MTLTVHMVANAHLDPVWLWPWQAGVDEALSTMRAMVRRCHEYPGFIFTRGEVWVYEWVERIDPVLFEEVRALVSSGQIHIPSAQFIQPDVNVASEEAIRRQFAYGFDYYREKFGVRPVTGHNVDTFGHTATLPDILAGLGYIGYHFRRPDALQMELSTCPFRWRGVNGGEVIAYRIPSRYNSAGLDELRINVAKTLQAADPAIGHCMCFYGVGNHGGGPSKACIEWVIANRHAFDGAELVFSTPEAFYRALENRREFLPVYQGEIQNTFPGTYSAMHRVKQSMRHTELKLQHARQLVDCFAEPSRKAGLQLDLDRAWREPLFAAFHDIVTGTGINSAMPSVHSMLGRADIVADEIIVTQTRRWASKNLPLMNEHQRIFLNSSKREFSGLVEFEPWLDEYRSWDDRWLSDECGVPVAFQQIQPEAPLMNRLLVALDVPAQGCRRLLVRSDPAPEHAGSAIDLSVSPQRLANGKVEIALCAHGIRQITLGGEPLLGNAGLGLQLRIDDSDVWTMHSDRFEQDLAAAVDNGAWAIEEAGPLRVRVRMDGLIGSSRFSWVVGLERDASRIDMRLEINYDERHRILQMPIHFADAQRTRTDGLAGGAIVRDPSGQERPFYGWTLNQGQRIGAAVISHDIYSLSHRTDQLILTLLRSPKAAWSGYDPLPRGYGGREYYTDQGCARFEWSILLAAALPVEQVEVLAEQAGHPLIGFDHFGGMDRPLPEALNQKSRHPLYVRYPGRPETLARDYSNHADPDDVVQ